MKDNSLFSTGIGYVYYPEVTNYFKKSPFNPPERYPELPFIFEIDKENRIYPMVRELLQKIGLDKDNIGTPKWNPFRNIVKPGDNVVIKPNLLIHYHHKGRDALFSTIIHGSIVRPIIDYLYLALDGGGSIIIADNPVESANFELLMEFTGLEAMVNELTHCGYRGLGVADLRPRILKEARDGRFYYENQIGDPLGYITIELAKDSLFSEFDNNPDIHYYTLADHTVDHSDPACNSPSATDRYHNATRHAYNVSKSILNADVIMNIAKLKTHCKAGVTLALKNMVGVVYQKECIPHHRPGSPHFGDSFPDYPPSIYVKSRKIYQKLKTRFYLHHLPVVKSIAGLLHRNKPIEHGNWKGNDTIWRTILDLNRIVIYADKNGLMQDKPQRKFFFIIDGIVGQEGNAPMGGEPKRCGIILGGFNPVIVDALVIKAMGIDYQMIKSVSKAKEIVKWKLLPDENIDLSLPDINVPNISFELPKGWR